MLARSWREEQVERYREALYRELGDAVVEAMEDDDVLEVLLNPDGRLWVDTHSQGMRDTGVSVLPAQAESLLKTVAGLLGEVVHEKRPVLETAIPFLGSRMAGLLPPIVTAPAFAIRKRPAYVYPLSSYVEEGALSPGRARVLTRALEDRMNIIVSGGPGSGKTTLANALLHEMVTIFEDTLRFCLLEDTLELRCSAKNKVVMLTSEDEDLNFLLKRALRMRPARLVIGEVRGAEAHELLKAWNMGVPGGLATVHANSALEALDRLDHLAQEAGVGPQARLVGESVDLVVHIERTNEGRRIRKVLHVESWKPEVGYQVRCAESAGQEGGLQ